MNRILIKRIEADLSIATLCINDDNIFTQQLAAFHIQQAAEKIIKQVLDIYKSDYENLDDFYILLNKISRKQDLLSIDSIDFFINNRNLFLNWNFDTRYESNYMATLSLIQEKYYAVSRIFKELVNSLREYDEKNFGVV